MLFAGLMEMVKAFGSEFLARCRVAYKLQNGTLGLGWFKLLPQIVEKGKWGNITTI